jgi:hypothetical protein
VILEKLVEKTDLSVEQVWETAEFLYFRIDKESDAEQLGRTILRKLVERTDLSVEQKWTTVLSLDERSPEGSDEQLFATSVILTLLSHSNKSQVKNDVYGILRSMVPQFHKIALFEERSQS